MSNLEERVIALERVLAGELPAQLRPAWTDRHELVGRLHVPGPDPTCRFELQVDVHPTGMRLRLLMNGYLVAWEREVFFAER